MKQKKKISLLLALALGITPVIYSFETNKTYAEEFRETKINEFMAKKLGIKTSDVIFSNFDTNFLIRYFNHIKPTYVGIASETIETITYTREELLALKKIQDAVYRWHTKKISKSDCQFIVERALDGLTGWAVKKIGLVTGIKIAAVRYTVSTMLDFVNNSGYNTMKKWLEDGNDLIQKAIDTGKNNVTLKYMKITWKTSDISIISGGAILK